MASLARRAVQPGVGARPPAHPRRGELRGRDLGLRRDPRRGARRRHAGAPRPGRGAVDPRSRHPAGAARLRCRDPARDGRRGRHGGHHVALAVAQAGVAAAVGMVRGQPRRLDGGLGPEGRRPPRAPSIRRTVPPPGVVQLPEWPHHGGDDLLPGGRDGPGARAGREGLAAPGAVCDGDGGGARGGGEPGVPRRALSERRRWRDRGRCRLAGRLLAPPFHAATPGPGRGASRRGHRVDAR